MRRAEEMTVGKVRAMKAKGPEFSSPVSIYKRWGMAILSMTSDSLSDRKIRSSLKPIGQSAQGSEAAACLVRNPVL